MKLGKFYLDYFNEDPPSNSFEMLQNIASVLTPYFGYSRIEEMKSRLPKNTFDQMPEWQMNKLIQNSLKMQGVELRPQSQDPHEVYQDLLSGIEPTFPEGSEMRQALEYACQTVLCDSSDIYGRIVWSESRRSYAILIDLGLWWFLSGMPKLISLSSRMVDTSSRQQANSISSEKLLSIRTDYINLLGKCPYLLHDISTMYLKDDDQELFAAQLEKYSKQFVIAHELAHLFGGHVADAPRPLGVRVDQGSAGENRTHWDEEYFADGLAISLLINSKSRSQDQAFEAVWVFAGAVFFLNCLDIIEKAYAIPPTSHPPANTRLTRLREYIAQIIPDSELLKVFINRYDVLSKIMKPIADEHAYSCADNSVSESNLRRKSEGANFFNDPIPSSWLTERVFPPKSEEPITDRLGFLRIPDANEENDSLDKVTWGARFGEVLQSGDEVWSYRSPPDSWRELHGRAGYAMVRNGEVVAYDIFIMN